MNESLPSSDLQTAETAPVFNLPADMTIETAAGLAAVFRQIAAGGYKNVTLDASQVGALTTPGIQLIASLQKTLAATGGALVVTGGRASFTCAFTDTGLAGLLK